MLSKKTKETKKIIKDNGLPKELLKATEGEIVKGFSRDAISGESNGYIPFIVKKSKKGRKAIDIRNYIDRIKPFMLEGQSLSSACRSAMVPYDTVSNYMKKSPAVKNEIESYQGFLTNIAKKNVGSALVEGDLETSKWHLDRTEYKKESPLQGLDGSGSIEIKWEVDKK